MNPLEISFVTTGRRSKLTFRLTSYRDVGREDGQDPDASVPDGEADLWAVAVSGSRSVLNSRSVWSDRRQRRLVTMTAAQSKKAPQKGGSGAVGQESLFWDARLTGAIQSNLMITRHSGESAIEVDNLEVAQFIYLLLNNERIRHVIDTITSKVLGRFTPERKAVLEGIRDELGPRFRGA